MAVFLVKRRRFLHQVLLNLGYQWLQLTIFLSALPKNLPQDDEINSIKMPTVTTLMNFLKSLGMIPMAMQSPVSTIDDTSFHVEPEAA